MAVRTAKLHLAPGGIGSSIEVDGKRLTGVRGVRIAADASSIPEIFVDFVIHEIDVDGEVIVTVPDETRDALVALGWTPPADKPTSGAGQKSKIALNIQPKEPESRVIVVGDPRMRA